MNAVFLDTVGLLALWNRSDQWHESAEAAFQSLLARRSLLLTTSLVLLECGNAAARHHFVSKSATSGTCCEAAGSLSSRRTPR